MVAKRPSNGSTSGKRAPQAGFALLVAVAVIAVIAVLSTVVAVTLSGDNDQARIERAADVLHRLVAAIDTPETGPSSFIGALKQGPLQLSELTHGISIADSSCSTNNIKFFSPADAKNWNGPYYLTPIPTSGYRIETGFFADNTLIVDPLKNGLAIQMRGVSLPDAQGLELLVERLSTGAGPLVTFPLTDPTTVQYHLSTAGNIC